MENTIQLSKSHICFKNKPLDSAVWNIIKSLKTTICTQDDMEYYSTFTYPVCPAVFKGGNKDNASWVSQQSFYLDFDKGLELEDALKRLEGYSIIPNFYYYTFSHTRKKPRFRIVLILDEIITDKSDCQKILKFFGKLYPECDHKCLTLPHMYYGGKEVVHITNERVSFEKLSVIAGSFLLRDSKSDEVGKVILKNKKSNNSDEFPDENARIKYKNKLRDYDMDWDKLYQKSPTYRDFVDGRWMHHDELFGVLSNMICFENGDKKWLEIIEKHNNNESIETYYGDDKLKLISVIRSYDYLPQHLESFSKCEDDHFFTTFYNVMVREKRYFEKIDNDNKPVYRKLKLVTDEMCKKLDEIMKEKNSNIYLIVAPPGAGKTQWITKQKNLQIASPTYALLEETSKRMVHDWIATKAKPQFTDKEINKKINYFYSVGFHEKVRSFIGEVARNKNISKEELDIGYCSEDIDKAKDYMDSIKKFEESAKNIMTTHRHTIYRQYKDTIVFDEDPFSDIFNIQEISIKSIIELLEKFKDNDEYMDIIEMIKGAELGKVIKKKKISFDKEELIKDMEFSIPGNIFDFFDSELFILEDEEYSDKLFYFIHNELQEDRKYIIFTASPNTILYKKAYGDRLKVCDFSDIENKGQIIQYIDYSCSQSSLEGKNCVDFVKKHIGYDAVITYQKYRELFPNNSTQLYFWNLLGYNYYNNRNINVVGTPHLPEHIYRLYGGFLGIDVNSEGKMEKRKVAHNNYYFNFRTFENKEMQELQFELIENELTQAIGRTRLVHNNKIVRVFSNFPVKGAVIMNSDEEENIANSTVFEKNNEELIKNNEDFMLENEEKQEKSA